jgi:hypothetical protein
MMRKTYITSLFGMLPVLFLSLVSCTNPILKWIGTSSSGDLPVITDNSRNSRRIIGFVFEELEAWGMKIDPLISAVPRPDGSFDILVIVPPDTNLTALSPRITHTGVFISGDGVAGEARTINASAQNFTSPKTYIVKAENGSTRKYIVTVILGFDGDPNAGASTSEKEITSFYFTNPIAVGEIDQSKNHITVVVPPGTDLHGLAPTVYYKGKSLSPVSGAPDDFTTPRRYTVTAGDNSARNYDVQVTVKSSSAKEIIDVVFNEVTVSKTIIGSLPGPDGKIPIDVMVTGHPDLTGLKPVISHTGVSISPASGSVQNFDSPVSYQVSAEDGSTKDYAITVYFADGGKIITGFSFDSTPGGPIVGQIYQAAHTIEVVIPHSASSLTTPTITYFGTSISYSGTSMAPQTLNPGTENPYTDSGRTFTPSTSDPRGVPIYPVYTVTATDGTTQDYVVIASKADENLDISVSFQQVSDAFDLLSYAFNPDSSYVTVSINATNAATQGFANSYKWYLNGQEYPAVNTETTLVIQTKDLYAGQHEVVLETVKGTQDRYTSKLYFVVNK